MTDLHGDSYSRACAETHGDHRKRESPGKSRVHSSHITKNHDFVFQKSKSEAIRALLDAININISFRESSRRETLSI